MTNQSDQRKNDMHLPLYKIGDWVVRRPGTLGNMDGTAASGRVEDIFERYGHTMVMVQFGSRRETFVLDTYVKARP
jgi:hypothetical protein